jgi:hypothetical protein
LGSAATTKTTMIAILEAVEAVGVVKVVRALQLEVPVTLGSGLAKGFVRTLQAAGNLEVMVAVAVEGVGTVGIVGPLSGFAEAARTTGKSEAAEAE